jgi:hypothetical protein
MGKTLCVCPGCINVYVNYEMSHVGTVLKLGFQHIISDNEQFINILNLKSL